MPDTSITRQTAALAGVFDARAFAGEAAFTRDVGGVATVSTISISADVFPDVLAFLHGFGSAASASLPARLQAAWSSAGCAGTITCGIDESDRFYIETDAAAGDFKIANTADAGAFGFLGALDFVGGVAPFRHTASGDWRRGVFELTGVGLKLTPSGAGSVHYTPGDYPRVQSLPTWIRARGAVGDSDDAYSLTCLEAVEPLAGAHWLVDADGRVSVSYIAADAFTAKTAALWQRLGFNGREVAVAGVGVGAKARSTLTAANRCPCFLAPDRGYAELRRQITNRDTLSNMADGSVVSAGLPPTEAYSIKLRVPGPAHGHAASMEDHLRRWWQYARSGLTLYPQWGDLDEPARGSIDVRRHAEDVDRWETAAGYTTGQTIEGGTLGAHYGRRRGGRILLPRAVGDDARRMEAYRGQAIDAHQDVTIMASVAV